MPDKYDVVDSRGKIANHYASYDRSEMNKARAVARRRRWLYAAFVVATLTFAFLPLFLPGSSGVSCVGWICLAGLPLRLASSVLPDGVLPWIEGWIAVVENGWGLAGIVVTALVLLGLKRHWYAATRKHAMAAWAELKRG